MSQTARKCREEKETEDEEVGKMNEITCKNIKKTLCYEESDEILSVEVSLDNISSQTDKDVMLRMLKTMWKRIIKELQLDDTGFY